MPGARSEDRKRSVLFRACLSCCNLTPSGFPTAGGGTTIGNARLADDKINKPC